MSSVARSCIAVADSSRALILAHHWPAIGNADSGRRPARPLRNLVSLGQRSGYPCPSPTTDGDAERYRQQRTQRFAREIAKAIGVVCQLMEHCRLILWASSDVLDDVREALAIHPEWTRGIDEYVEGYRSLKRLDVPEIRDWLAGVAPAESLDSAWLDSVSPDSAQPIGS